MAKSLFVLLLFAFAAHGQVQERVAILNTVDDSNPELDFTVLTYLTNSLREIAVKMLPENKYFVMTSQSIIEMLGPERKEECKNKCMLDMGKAISADYIGQARLGRLGGNLTITMELYHTRGNLIGSFNGNAKDEFGLVAVINEKAPAMFGKMSGIVYVPEPESAPVPTSVPEDAVPKPEKPIIRTSFWVAIGLDVLGVALISYAVYENSEMNKAYKDYGRSWGSSSYYENAWKDAESKRGTRNTLYVVGGIFLASGIGVHIWF